MTDNDHTGRNVDPEIDEQEMRRLIQSAGRRPDVPTEELLAIRQTVHAAWRKQWPAKSGNRRWIVLSGLAAAAAVVLTFVFLRPLSTGDGGRLAEVVATVEKVLGPALISTTEGAVVDVEIDDASVVRAGQVVETQSDSRALTLRLANGFSVRIGAATRLRLLSDRHLEIESGALYAQSAVAGASEVHLQIDTPDGTVRDVGTQFEIRVDPMASTVLRIRVREGEILLRTTANIHTASRGEEITVLGSGEVERGTVSPWGPHWSWVLEAAPLFEIDGRPLSQLLDSLTRETGWSLHPPEPQLVSVAESCILYGGPRDLTSSPAETVGELLQSCGLTATVEDGVLTIATD